MEIYLHLDEKIQVVTKKIVFLSDLGEVFVTGKPNISMQELAVFCIAKDEDATYLLSIVDIIKAIHQKYPNATIHNLGGAAILLEYHVKPKKTNKIFELCKVAFVSLVLFTGAATTIMCFQTDGQLPQIFLNYYEMFFGVTVTEVPAILSIPYSIGLGVGVILFFNHFSKFSITDDPTPIEIEMTTYETDANACIMDNLASKKGKKP
ncbi:stage V sporulation protein AA [Chakrabartyella piscis]|uniref:stage V sporulation protein AA n=1 Tax=Chakrabartyella piscis TaxID=2918914 RepID=UPI002958C898|nr:stage V sporulation protein AA [Chakrabartyella piscis]